MSTTSRRAFVAMAASSARILGANDRIRGAAIGLGGRGAYLTANFKELGVEMAAVCDVWEPRRASGLKAASTGARAYDNYRRMLEDKSIDVVVIATPDHWHAQMSIDAVEAGKDVYVEKPMALTIEDAYRMEDAVRRTRRVLQVGSQRRSSEICLEARKIVESGTLGTVRLLNCWWHGRTISQLRQRKLEGHLDWEQWLGPAPKRPFDPIRFFNWLWFWEYGGGYMIGQTVHILDATHMFMNPGHPLAVTALGKNSIPGSEIPETTSISVEYRDYLAVFTVGYKAMRYNPPEMSHELKQLNGSAARLDVGRETLALYDEDPEAVDLKPRIELKKYGAIERSVRAHIRDFLECVRTRRDPRASVEAGRESIVVLAMAGESLRSRRTVGFDPATRSIRKLS